MESLIIINYAYIPNSAFSNRFLSFLRGFDELKIMTNVYLFCPSDKKDKISYLYKYVSIQYLWDDKFPINKIGKHLKSLCLLRQFIKKIPSGSNVLLFGPFICLSVLVKKKGIKVYHERTEHPDVVSLRPTIFQKIYLNACKKLTGIFVISTSLQKYFMDLGVKNVHIINMIVDINRFNSLYKQECEDYVAYCGTISNTKDGVDLLIKSFAIVVKEYKTLKLKIIGEFPMIGEKNQNLNLIKQLGLENNIEFTGLVNADKMPQLLKNAKMLVLNRPNNLQSKCGFPTKLGEYLLTENPVVVTSVGDIPKFLKDRESALVVQPNDIDEFAEKMIWVMEHPIESNVIGKNGASVAKEYFNYSIETQKIIDVIYNK